MYTDTATAPDAGTAPVGAFFQTSLCLNNMVGTPRCPESFRGTA